MQTVEQRLKALEDKVNNIDNVIAEASSIGRTGIGNYTRILNIESALETLNKTYTDITNNIKALMVDSKYVELFTSQEIKDFYMSTDFTVKEVKELIDTHFPEKKDLTIQTIGNYVQGVIPDVHIRSFLGKFLRNEANKKSIKTKQDGSRDKKSIPMSKQV
jgi:hypothetical protein